MELLTQIQLTEAQQEAHLRGEIVRISATWDEFLDFLETTNYRAEYTNHEIIIMGLAKALHEWLVIRIATLLSNLYLGENFFVYGSNIGIQSPAKPRYHNADVTVIEGKADFYGNSKSIITNPYLIVEVLSEGTKEYDLNEKLEDYQRMTSLQHLVYVDGSTKSIKTYSRTADPRAWLMTFYEEPEDVVLLDKFTVKLSAIFANMPSF